MRGISLIERVFNIPLQSRFLVLINESMLFFDVVGIWRC
jgi:hypothetical protein